MIMQPSSTLYPVGALVVPIIIARHMFQYLPHLGLVDILKARFDPVLLCEIRQVYSTREMYISIHRAIYRDTIRLLG
jgi:hypothetical protein